MGPSCLGVPGIYKIKNSCAAKLLLKIKVLNEDAIEELSVSQKVVYGDRRFSRL